ncbi:MAG: hypothetical protein KKB88_02240 [Nanoarchaeota archaeon]|nr:hypothetical protein [Nanoarchaeota archaeon]
MGWFQLGMFGAGQVEWDSLSYSDSGNTYTYTLVVDYSQPESYEFGGWDEYLLAFNVGYSGGFSPPPALPSDIQKNTYFPVQSANWQLIASPADNTLKYGLGTIKITEKENNVECKVVDSGSLECRGGVLYSFSPTAHSMQRNDLKIVVKIDKISQESPQETITTTEDDGFVGEPITQQQTQTISFVDKINNFIQGIINWITGLFK